MINKIILFVHLIVLFTISNIFAQTKMQEIKPKYEKIIHLI